jgi:hypothetical protein
VQVKSCMDLFDDAQQSNSRAFFDALMADEHFPLGEAHYKFSDAYANLHYWIFSYYMDLERYGLDHACQAIVRALGRLSDVRITTHVRLLLSLSPLSSRFEVGHRVGKSSFGAGLLDRQLSSYLIDPPWTPSLAAIGCSLGWSEATRLAFARAAWALNDVAYSFPAVLKEMRIAFIGCQCSKQMEETYHYTAIAGLYQLAASKQLKLFNTRVLPGISDVCVKRIIEGILRAAGIAWVFVVPPAAPPAAPAPKPGAQAHEKSAVHAAAAADANACVICLERPKNVLLQPCRHLCVCQACSPTIAECPLCRTNIDSRIHAYV